MDSPNEATSAISNRRRGYLFASAFARRPFGLASDEARFLGATSGIAVVAIVLRIGALDGFVVASMAMVTAIAALGVRYDGASLARLVARGLGYWLSSAAGVRRDPSDPRVNAQRVAPKFRRNLGARVSAAALLTRTHRLDGGQGLVSGVYGAKDGSGLLVGPASARVACVLEVGLGRSPFLIGAQGLGEMHQEMARVLDSIARLGADAPRVTLVTFARDALLEDRAAQTRRDLVPGKGEYGESLGDLYEKMLYRPRGPRSFVSLSISATADPLAAGDRGLAAAFAHLEEARRLCASWSPEIFGRNFIDVHKLRWLVTNCGGGHSGRRGGREKFDRIQMPGADMKLYRVVRWPQAPVLPGAIGALFLDCHGLRATSVTFQAVSPAKLARHARAGRARSIATARVAGEAGFLTRPGDSLGVEALEAMESEQLAGRAGVTISALAVSLFPTTQQARLHEDFATRGIVTRREFGRQGLARREFAALGTAP